MGLSADAYAAQLAALLPRGLAWPREPGSTLAGVLGAWAEEFARLDARGWTALEEADPRATVEMLTDWERAYGLPDPCLASDTQTVATRRAALLARILDRGGQRPADMIALAAVLGITATVHEFRPWTVADPIDRPIAGVPWAYAWELVAETGFAVTAWTVGSTVAEPLAVWSGSEALRCLLRRAKPAHTTLMITEV